MFPAAHPARARRRSPAAILTEAELLGASVAPGRRAEADRLLEDLRFDLAREEAHEPALGDGGLLLAELRKLTTDRPPGHQARQPL